MKNMTRRKIKLDYGRDGLEITLPDSLRVDIIQPKHKKALPDQAGAVDDALLNPIDSKPLPELISKSGNVGIVFNDITRPTPYKIILPVFLRWLENIPDKQISLFNATGSHRANTQAELRNMLGDEVVKKYRIVQNDAHDKPSHKSVGTTESGNEIFLHKDYLDCQTKILTGFIEPHIFAGFSGGAKAAMPGLALIDTIIRNHSVGNIDHPNSTWGVTSGNPIFEQIRQAALMAPPTFLLNVTLNRQKQITSVFAGDFRTAHDQGCEYVRKNAMAAVEKPYDIVITSNSGYPLDLNLYQSIKGMSAAARIVKKGGSIIMASDCWDGIPDHGRYNRFLSESDSYEALLKMVHEEGFFEHDMWQAQLHGLICRKAHVYFHSRNLSDEKIKNAFLNPCPNIEQTVEELLNKYGRNASVCVLPEGPQTIPYIAEN
jgi:nickel-dependent lactate racemase